MQAAPRTYLYLPAARTWIAIALPCSNATPLCTDDRRTESTDVSSQDQACDVIVAGAGPVGLLLAAELTLAGASVVVLERLSEISTALMAMLFGRWVARITLLQWST